jgi:TolB-like protein
MVDGGPLMVRQLVTLFLLAAPLRAQCPDGSPPPCRASAARAAAPATPVRGSIAVLPFSNRSADSSDAYLAEELPEQITGRLSRIAQLHVVSATAVAAQWRRTPDAIAAARALRVEWLVTGSLRRAGSQLSAGIELVRTATAEQAWSSPFRRSDGDIAAIEEQVAESVAVAVVGRLAPEQLAVLQRSTTRNPEAYRLYLQARALTVRRTIGDLAAAANAMTVATRLDPGFPEAWSRLSIVRSLQSQYGSPEHFSFDSLMTWSRTAVGRALALDSNIAESWLALGQVSAISGDLGTSWSSLQRAARLDSLNADIEHAWGYLYSVDILVQPEEAERHFRRAVTLNPDLRNSWRHLGLTYEARGNTAVALAYLDTALVRGNWTVGVSDYGWLHYESGDARIALAAQARADSLGPASSSWLTPVPATARRALYAAAAGDSAAAFALLADGSDSADLAAKAIVAMGLGRRDLALASLEALRAVRDPREQTCAPRTPCSTSLRTWRTMHVSIFRSLANEPRFQRLFDDTRPRIPWL